MENQKGTLTPVFRLRTAFSGACKFGKEESVMKMNNSAASVAEAVSGNGKMNADKPVAARLLR